MPDGDSDEDENEERLNLQARLQSAAQNGEVQVVEKVLDCFGKDDCDEHVQLALAEFLSSQDGDGWTALHFACQGGTPAHKVIVRRLCKSKADVNVVDKQGWSPLHVAAQFAEEPILDVLITYLADRKLKDYNGMTPHECANGVGRTLMLQLPEVMLEGLLGDVRRAVAELMLVQLLSEEELARLEKLEDHVQEQILRAQADVDRRETRVKELMEEDLSDSTMGARMNQVKNMIKFKKEAKNIISLMGTASGLLSRLRETTANSHIVAAVVELEQIVKDFEAKAAHCDVATLNKPKMMRYGTMLPSFERQIAMGKNKKVPLLPGEMGGSEDEEDHVKKKEASSKSAVSEEGFCKREKVRVKDKWMSGWRSGRVKSFPPLLVKVESMNLPSHWDSVEKAENDEGSDKDEDGDGDIDIDDGHYATQAILKMARHLQENLHDLLESEIDTAERLALERDILDTIGKFNRKRMAGSFKPTRNRGETGICTGNLCMTQ